MCTDLAKVIESIDERLSDPGGFLVSSTRIELVSVDVI